jgi:hypothetical protein
MGNNIAIITDTAKTVTLETISDYGAGVFAHPTQDFAQHTQMQVYTVPYSVSSSTVTAVSLSVKVYKNVSSHTIIDAASKHVTSLIFTNLYGSLTSTSIQFYASLGGAWHPFGLKAFGADITGIIVAATTTNYTFDLRSDDGSYLFIDVIQVVNNGGNHGYRSRTGTINLAAGNHVFEVQFYENGAGPSGVDLFLPSGITYLTQTIVQQNIIATQSLYLGLTFNGSTIPLALPLNATGSNTSLNSPPIIITQPVNLVNAGIGDTAQFVVVVLSNLAVAYQWQRNAPVGLAGQQTLRTQGAALEKAIYALPLIGFTAPQSTNQTKAKQISARLVSELPNSLTLAPTTTALTDAQSLVALVADATVSLEIQVLVVAIQNSILTSIGAGTPFNNMSGQTSATMVLTNVQTSDAALYRAIISNANGSVISSTGTLVVSAFKSATKK